MPTTETTFAPAKVVEMPYGAASPRQVSLLSSVIVNNEPNDREWGSGLTWRPDSCAPPDNPYWWICPEGRGVSAEEEYGTKLVGEQAETYRFRPFTIWTGYECSTFGFLAQEAEARARRLLEAKQSAMIEAELWTGTVAQAGGFPNDYITNSPSSLSSSGIVTALAELEQAGSEVSGIPVIHAQPRVVAAWCSQYLVTPSPSGRQLRTCQGTLVVPGSGYSGAHDGDPVSKTRSHAAVTGMVAVYLGPVRITSAEETSSRDNSAGSPADSDVDTRLNNLVVRAERTAAVVFDPCVKAIINVKLDSLFT